ncbi:MAG TPA: TolC family protein [Gemmatimonadales bacterium]|nr:TolC family protein [Gemmatimonadales bacterium]
MRPAFLLCLALLPAMVSPAAGQQPDTSFSAPLTLLDAIRLGRERALSAVTARLVAEAGRIKVSERAGELLPQVSGAASWSRQTVNLDEFGIPIASGVTPPFNLYRFQLRASQTLFDAAAFSRLSAERNSAIATGQDARAAAELAGASAGIAYLRVLSTTETVRAREADSAVATDLLDQARKLVDAGISPAIDATRSEVSFGSVQTQLEVARNSRDRARLDLLRALDLPPSTELTLADSLTVDAVPLPETQEAAAAFAREHRAELIAARARTDAARKTLSAIHHENLPSVLLSGGVNETAQTLDELKYTYNVQLAINVPILDGLRRQRRARQQGIQVEVQEVQERSTRNQVDTDARQAVLDLASARQQVAIAGDRLRLSEQELSQAQERFTNGVAGSVETTNAQGSLIEARDALIQARVNYANARVAAYRALGVIDQLR